jgi:hypothetical protein
MYDPFEALRQAWDVIGQGGMIYVGSQTGEPRLPIMMSEQDASERNMQASFNQIKVIYKSVSAFFDQWNRSRREISHFLDSATIEFDSAFPDNQTIKQLVEMYLTLPEFYPQFNTGSIFQLLGIPFREIGDERKRIHGYVLSKTNGDNPFKKLTPFGVGQNIDREKCILPQRYYKMRFSDR